MLRGATTPILSCLCQAGTLTAQAVLPSLQVDTTAKKVLLGVALAYIGLVVVLPFVNVFIQVCVCRADPDKQQACVHKVLLDRHVKACMAKQPAKAHTACMFIGQTTVCTIHPCDALRPAVHICQPCSAVLSCPDYALWFVCCPALHCAGMQAFAKGVGPFLEAVQEHDFQHATKLTLMLAAIAVPLNTVFGTVAAILITRNEFPGKVGAACQHRQRLLSSVMSCAHLCLPVGCRLHKLGWQVAWCV